MTHTMNNLALLEGEKPIAEYRKNGLFVLTNKRVQFHQRGFASEELTSILLRNISSASLRHKNPPLLLSLAVLTVLGGMFLLGTAGFSYPVIVLFLFALVFLLGYFFHWEHWFFIASNGGQAIRFHASDMSRTKAHEFIHQLESAIEADRYRSS